MKLFLTICVCVIFLVTTNSLIMAQTNWTKYSGNPVLNAGAPGNWDDNIVWDPKVIWDGSKYLMWFSGSTGDLSHAQIGYATSLDGITWSKYGDNPVLEPGPPGTWDSVSVGMGAIVIDGDLTKMWYWGYDGTNAAVGYATSPDNSTWTKYENNPVLEIGSSDSWEGDAVWTPSVLYDGETYHMWFVGYSNNFNSRSIGYASSSDGINWQKYENNPILEKGDTGGWEDNFVDYPVVIYNNNIYQMWYAGYDGVHANVGYAESSDGIIWIKDSNNPVLQNGPVGSWDSKDIFCNTVILQDSVYKLWYEGYSSGSGAQIGYASDNTLTSIPNFNYTSPLIYSLSQNYPNPFNPSTSINFTLTNPEFVSLKIYNILGEEISTLLSKKLQAGNHTYQFDGSDLASGVYLYRIEAGEFQQVRKMVLIK